MRKISRTCKPKPPGGLTKVELRQQAAEAVAAYEGPIQKLPMTKVRT